MANTDIFLGSGASITFIPENDLFIGVGLKDGGAALDGSAQSIIQVNALFDSDFALITNLYKGCLLERYNVSDALQSTHRITSNDGNSVTITPSATAASTDYFVIKAYGAPVPAPKISSAGNTLGTPAITTAGTQIEADESIIINAAINGVSGFASTGAEIALTLSAESSTVTFVAESGTNYDGGLLTINLASPSGTNGITTLQVLYNTAGAAAPSASGNDSVTVPIADSATGAEIAQSVLTALNGKDVTVTRSGAILTITNNTGGYVGAAHIAETTTSATTETMGSVLGGIITGVTVTNAGSSVSGSGNLTITSNGGTAGVLALTTSTTTAAKRLLSDEWLGILESATFPTTEVEMKQQNLSLGGSRNYTYQYKGITSFSGGNLGLVANHGAWLYYFLGKCTTLTCSTDALATALSTDTHRQTLAHAATDNNKFLIRSMDATTNEVAAGDNAVIAGIVETGPIFRRTIGRVVCPPITPFEASDAQLDFYHSLDRPAGSTTLTEPITYTFAEQDGDLLPSFALEQSFSKLTGTNQYRTNSASEAEDLNFVKIARGCRVNTITMTANENEEVKMTMDLSTRNVHTPAQDEVYDARRGVTDETAFINYESSVNADQTREPFFFSDGTFKLLGNTFLKINTLTLTMANTLTDRRFLGVGGKDVQESIPAQRTYELQFTGHVTDDALYTALLNDSEDTTQTIELTFTKSNGENIILKFDDYFVNANSFPMADDKGPIAVEATVMPRTLNACTVKTHWVLQG